jgi:DNA-directed RNA polymerase alpha subunit/DNA-directed RNA polymerase subunit L
MNPKISNISFENETYNFTLSGLNVSLANAIRRTCLSDIPVVAIFTETYNDNQCTIANNTTRLHNEILKHRLSCIPVHTDDLDVFPDLYQLELDVTNDTDNMMVVTTEHFKIKNKQTDNYLTNNENMKIFPPCIKTGMYIDFVRLRPKISDAIPGEHIKLTAEFSIHTAYENGSFNAVSRCSYSNTVDHIKANSEWELLSDKYKAEQMEKADYDIQKRNFYLLDAYRYFITDSFDFSIQSVGVFKDQSIIKKACVVLQNKFLTMIQALESDTIIIKPSETTMDHSFDIILENEDYTIGKVIEFILYEKYYITDKVLTYCGFKKFHPHDISSTIRLAFVSATDKRMVGQHLRTACVDASQTFTDVYKLF